MTIEERMGLEKAAREAEHKGRPPNKEPPAGPQEDKTAGVDEVARQIAERAGVLVLCHFHRF